MKLPNLDETVRLPSVFDRQSPISIQLQLQEGQSLPSNISGSPLLIEKLVDAQGLKCLLWTGGSRYLDLPRHGLRGIYFSFAPKLLADVRTHTVNVTGPCRDAIA
jgi:hypothetical protein